MVSRYEYPSNEELTVEEVNVSYPILQAASVYVGKKCEWYNNEFMLCKAELQDPRKCLGEGKQVTACAMKVFQDLKKHCRKELETYSKCLNNSSSDLELSKCRNTQKVFDDCVLKNLQIERPPFDYFCVAKVHDSPRPKPVKPKPEEYPDRTPDLVRRPYRPSQYHYRNFWDF